MGQWVLVLLRVRHLLRNVSHAYQYQLYAYARGQIARPPAVTGYDIVLPEGIKCYTELLRAAGYYCTNNPKPTISFYRL